MLIEKRIQSHFWDKEAEPVFLSSLASFPRIAMSHDVPGVSCMQYKSERFSKTISRINDSWDMFHFNMPLLFPVLYRKVPDIDMSGSPGWLVSIYDVYC